MKTGLFFTLLIFSITANAKFILSSETGGSALLSKISKYEIRKLYFPNAIYGQIVENYNQKDRTWLKILILSQKHKDKRIWIEYYTDDLNQVLYGFQDRQIFQTRDLHEAKFLKIDTPSFAYLENSPGTNEELLNMDFYAQFPRTNYGLREIANLNEIENACPQHPLKRDGNPCPFPDQKFKLPRYLKSLIKKIAKKHEVHPAILTAIIHKESHFDPFGENNYEKQICRKAKKDPNKKCSEYKWGQGLGQLGATNAPDFGMKWIANLKRPKICRGRHIFNPSCFRYLERRCKRIFKKEGLWPTYCPSAGIDAVARFIRQLIKKQRKIIVPVGIEGQEPEMQLVDIGKKMRRTIAEEFRYIVGMYNRGMRPLNSIEEHFRQFGKAPKWYGEAWATPRKQRTPASDIGYFILHKEVINRCHVWQIAGLCGTSLEGSLAGQYLKEF